MPRRWLLLVAGVLVVVVVLASLGWYVWLPRYRPGLRAGERFGIDVSNHQGRIDWMAVRGDGVRFAYIKATEGGDFTDADFVANWAGARAAGVARGGYHFFGLCSPGATQAANFLSVLPHQPEDLAEALAPAVDLELAGNCSQRPDPAAVDRELTSFLGVVEAATRTPTVLYIADDFGDRYPASTSLQRPRWKLRNLRRPSGAWVVWQVFSLAHIKGIHGRVDIDVMGAPAGWSGIRAGRRRCAGPAPIAPWCGTASGS